MLFNRIRIPFIIDIVYIDDPDELYRLNENIYIDRNTNHELSLANWIVHSRIYNLITARSAYFPIFMKRGDPVRIELQSRLERKLAESKPSAELVGVLADYVLGGASAEAASRAMQEVCGKVIDEHFRATQETVRNARIVSDYVRGGLVTRLLFLSTNKVRRALGQLWTTANEDRLLMHAITLGPHGIRRALDNMKALTQDPKFCGKVDTATVVPQCVAAPNRLLRFANNVVVYREGRTPLKPGTLIVFLLRRIQAGTARSDIPFIKGTWSQCPAHDYIPKLLRLVWERVNV